MSDKLTSFVPALELERSPAVPISHCPDTEKGVLLELTPEMSDKLTSSVPILEFEICPVGTSHCSDAEKRVLLEQIPEMSDELTSPVPALEFEISPVGTSHCPAAEKQQTPEVRRPPTTPEAARCSRPKRRRLSTPLQDAEISSSVESSDDGSGVESGEEEFENFISLRMHTHLMSEEAMEEDLDVEDERVVEAVGIVEGDERMEDRVEGEDAEMSAIGQEFVNLRDYSWSEDFSTFSGQEETYLRIPGPSFATQDPVEAFMAVWDEEIMNEIVRQTNKYAWDMIAPLTEVEKPLPEPLSSWTDISTEELYEYFGVLILMSLCNRTVLSDYWTTGILEMANFRRLMSRNRFCLISRMLHFVDNDNHDPLLLSYERKISKISPILDHCNARFRALYTPCKYLSLDESLLLWKGRLGWVQSIRTKAARFGIKSYELCEAVSGYMLRCMLYAGKSSPMHHKPYHGFENSTAKVVLEVMDGFLDAGHTLVMDSWYNQLPLTRYLKRRKTDVIGTMDNRRSHVPNAIKNLNSGTMARGEQVARHCGDISLIAWKDLKLVTTVSTYHNDSRVSAFRAGTDIEKPLAIMDYNCYMGGVDSKDQQLSMFLMERKRGRKWYMKVFKRLLNTSLLNTYIIFKKNPAAVKAVTHRQFRERVARGLFERFAKRHSNVRQNVSEVCPGLPRRLIKGVNHFVAPTELRVQESNRHLQKRCVRCLAAGKRTMVTLMCTYCEVALCAGRCWADYHTLKKL